MGMSWSEPIRRALDIVPIVPDCEWFLRDPVFAGLHSFRNAPDGRQYGDTAHTLYPWHINGPAQRRRTTIVLPRHPTGNRYVGGRQYDIHTAIHELGHVVDEMTGFERECVPIGEYASRHRQEAFAEAFTAWLISDYIDRWGYTDLDEDDFAWFEANVR
ncbi:hypothetical protein LCGC14_1196910 [marine sediment metagenome]|uniref:Uncharacterized protein n=1 Tax=marine sediment metagenome TaxID=412755 RepID=A0A0F9LMI4_9ZZZZ